MKFLPMEHNVDQINCKKLDQKIPARRLRNHMKFFLISLAILISGVRLPAQTNAPIRLALVSEAGETFTAADVLTADLSGQKNLQLLERDEIEKVYREQGLSAANQDYLKLGQILGADGLLLLEVVRTPQATNLMMRLIAVKPGVILTDGSFAWPLKDTAQWAGSVSSYLDELVPKLSVQAGDAIPISVVNLRSAVASAEGAETERQLKLLTIQRLSQQPELFVLERQKMQLLSDEKDLNADDSTFWNGSYLLEGVVDQNGYSKETITINARLTPSKGGTPLLFEVSGSRTNLAAIVNQLAMKVNKALKVKSEVKEWNAADEAAQYFAEAQWSLRWGAYAEAQAAADTAWALGKQDLDCVSVRIRAYMNDVPLVVPPNVSIHSENREGIHYVHLNELPDPKYCDIAMKALQFYYDFCRTSPHGESKSSFRGNGWNNSHDSDWYQLGMDDLAAASRVLRHYNYVPASQIPVAEKLAELRALARSVADLISISPPVHDSYFVGDRIVVYDELYHFEDSPSIFSLKLDCGCLWQETPEDCVALYRELMSSPVFGYIHEHFWIRDESNLGLSPPRLVAWNKIDQKRLPNVWNNFLHELNESPDVLLQLEGKALKFADATNDPEMAAAFTNLMTGILESRDALFTNHVEVLYLNWGLDRLVEFKGSSSDELDQSYRLNYRPKIEAMVRDYQNIAIPALKFAAAYEEQKQYLKTNAPYDWFEFNKVFELRDYTKGQAVELRPLLMAYQSNLVAQAEGKSRQDQFKASSDTNWVEFYVGKKLKETINSMPPSKPKAIAIQPAKPAAVTKTIATISAVTNVEETVTNVLTVSKFLAIPLDELPGDRENLESSIRVTAHQWLEGKLLLDIQYAAFVYSFGTNGNWQSTRGATFPAIAILDPVTEHWQVIGCPEINLSTLNQFYHHTTLCWGDVFTSNNGQIKKYDSAKRQWRILPVSDGSNYELFTVSNRLYAASQNIIFEIMPEGNATRILASNRRQPPASALDAEDLGTPVLFGGPDGSLRVATRSNIVTWSNEDWRTICPMPQAPMPPVISDDGVLFHATGWNAPAGIWRLRKESDHVEFCLGKRARSAAIGSYSSDKNSKPMWTLPSEFSLPGLPAASSGSDLYLLADNAKTQDIVNEQQPLIAGTKFLPQDGYDAELLCFATNCSTPQKIFLKFESEKASPPVTDDKRSAEFVPQVSSAWLLFSTNYLFCGRETVDVLGGGNDSGGGQSQTGVWMIPLGQIDPEIARQRKIQLQQQAQSDALAKEAARELLEKYDRNHDGLIDREEREKALDDIGFIKMELNAIDTNHNCWLDPAELVYFDANTNGILEPKEQAGIEIAQHLLAERLLKKFDANDDGLLGRQEFSDLMQSRWDDLCGPTPHFQNQYFLSLFPDDNHDGMIDVAELEAFLKQQLRLDLAGLEVYSKQQLRQGPRPREAMDAAYFRRMITYPGKNVDASQSFKTYVELYWQNSSGITNKSSSHKTE
jgi:Ca2+-binding EF-hand superfamily protein